MIYCMIFDMIWVDIFASNRASPSVVLQPGFAEAQHERHLYDPDSSPPKSASQDFKKMREIRFHSELRLHVPKQSMDYFWYCKDP